MINTAKPIPSSQFADAEENYTPRQPNIEIKFSDRAVTSSYDSDVSDYDDADDGFYEADFKPVKSGGNANSTKLVINNNN